LVITILPTSAEVKEVYFKEDGVLAGFGDRGGIIIDMSTKEPMVSQELAALPQRRKWKPWTAREAEEKSERSKELLP
jgi:3-hydroxyisobutyrate dehydrogenase-like beta-hydroxyacid dehydrogenase